MRGIGQDCRGQSPVLTPPSPASYAMGSHEAVIPRREGGRAVEYCVALVSVTPKSAARRSFTEVEVVSIHKIAFPLTLWPIE